MDDDDPKTDHDRLSDEQLLAELKAALDAGRHPQQEKLIADAKEAFSFLAVSDEFAALVFDSMWEDKVETGSRAMASIRTLAFESAEVSLEIELSAEGVVGQVSPPGSARVEAEWADGTTSVAESDEFGSFTLASTGSGPVRFRISRDGSRTLTDWINAAG